MCLFVQVSKLVFKVGMREFGFLFLVVGQGQVPACSPCSSFLLLPVSVGCASASFPSDVTAEGGSGPARQVGHSQTGVISR